MSLTLIRRARTSVQRIANIATYFAARNATPARPTSHPHAKNKTSTVLKNYHANIKHTTQVIVRDRFFENRLLTLRLQVPRFDDGFHTLSTNLQNIVEFLIWEAYECKQYSTNRTHTIIIFVTSSTLFSGDINYVRYDVEVWSCSMDGAPVLAVWWRNFSSEQSKRARLKNQSRRPWLRSYLLKV